MADWDRGISTSHLQARPLASSHDRASSGSQETRSSWSALLMSPSGWFPDESAASLGILVGSGDISSGSWSGWGMDSF